jgi:hypothetical protein
MRMTRKKTLRSILGVAAMTVAMVGAQEGRATRRGEDRVVDFSELWGARSLMRQLSSKNRTLSRMVRDSEDGKVTVNAAELERLGDDIRSQIEVIGDSDDEPEGEPEQLGGRRRQPAPPARTPTPRVVETPDPVPQQGEVVVDVSELRENRSLMRQLSSKNRTLFRMVRDSEDGKVTVNAAEWARLGDDIKRHFEDSGAVVDS